ncbi:LodA/GoxA family CTQ-dependent oxidase, partial [Frankia sp. CpI1-P]
MTVTPTQYWQLEQWAKGNFDADYGTDDDPGNAPARNLGDVDIAEQPSTLDRAALSFCLADAFHPGCEVTWPVRHTTMYSAPFRIRHRDPDQPETDY